MEQSFQGFSLRDGPGKPVEKETGMAIGVVEPFRDDLHYKIVANEAPGIEDGSDSLTQLGTRSLGGPQNLTSG